MKVLGFLVILFAVRTVNASSELPNPDIKHLPSSQRILSHTFTDKDDFYSSVKAKLEEDNMRVDNLKLDGPDSNGPQLVKIEDELKSLHEVISTLNSVKEDNLKALEKTVADNFNSLEGRLSKMESEF